MAYFVVTKTTKNRTEQRNKKKRICCCCCVVCFSRGVLKWKFSTLLKIRFIQRLKRMIFDYDLVFERDNLNFTEWISIRLMSCDKVIYEIKFSMLWQKMKENGKTRDTHKFIECDFCTQWSGQNVNKWIPNVFELIWYSCHFF